MTKAKSQRQWIFQPKPLATFDHYRRISLAAMLSCLGGFGPVPEITSARKYPLYTEAEDALIASVVTEAILAGRRYGATSELMERLGRSEASVNNRVCRLRKQGQIPPRQRRKGPARRTKNDRKSELSGGEIVRNVV